MREIKFRFRVLEKKTQQVLTEYYTLDEIVKGEGVNGLSKHGYEYECLSKDEYIGLKDKNGLQEVYEGDIIDTYGNIKGNIYQMDKGETDLVIQEFGGKDWCSTYKEAMARGCTNS